MNHNLESYRDKEGMQIPEGYFEEVHMHLKKQTAHLLNEGMQTPEDYFDQVQTKLASQVESNTPKTQWSTLLRVAAIGILLVSGLLFIQSNDQSISDQLAQQESFENFEFDLEDLEELDPDLLGELLLSESPSMYSDDELLEHFEYEDIPLEDLMEII